MFVYAQSQSNVLSKFCFRINLGMLISQKIMSEMYRFKNYINFSDFRKSDKFIPDANG